MFEDIQDAVGPKQPVRVECQLRGHDDADLERTDLVLVPSRRTILDEGPLGEYYDKTMTITRLGEC